jgi:uncharacterized protein YrrD
MLRAFRRFHGHRLHATDGEIGSVTDLYFSDDTWQVRYLVVDIGSLLSGRTVLLIPGVLEVPAAATDPIRVHLTREEIRRSPDVDTKRPVSRQHELALHSYFGWPPYWGGGPITSSREGYTEGINPALTGSEIPPAGLVSPQEEEAGGDPHLRSASELDGYHVHAEDGEVGSVTDVLIDDDDWRVRYLAARTGGWLLGRHVVFSPQWVRDVSWAESSVYLDLDRRSIASAPQFNPAGPFTREEEERLYQHYSRPPYWR